MATGKSIPKVAILVVGNNLSQSVIDQFLWGINGSAHDAIRDNHYKGNVLIGSHEDQEQKFFKTTILNDMIRQSLKTYDIMIQTDIDMIPPPSLISKTLYHCLNSDSCFHANFLHAEPDILTEDYRKMPWMKLYQSAKYCSASGSWNGMNRNTWIKSGGFSEVISLLGGPDSEFYIRTSKKGIDWHVESPFPPLLHINHKRRNLTRQGKKNMKRARQYPNDYDWINNRNPKVCKTSIQQFPIG
jgi:hypothetical protein